MIAHSMCGISPLCGSQSRMLLNQSEANISGSVLLQIGSGKHYIPAAPAKLAIRDSVTFSKLRSRPKNLFCYMFKAEHSV